MPDPATYTVNDRYGRTIWTKDAGGFLNYTAYDPGTGAVVKTISDVDTSGPPHSNDYTALPIGWCTPSGGGLHQITTMDVDSLGRTTKLIDPNQSVTYTVYMDPVHEVRTYPGWYVDSSSEPHTTGPIQVTVEDRAAGITDALTMSGGAEHHRRRSRRDRADHEPLTRCRAATPTPGVR